MNIYIYATYYYYNLKQFKQILGIVESIGKNVTTLAVGDHVIPSYMFQCKECTNCKHPDNNFCVKTKFTSSTQLGVMQDGTTRFSINGKPIYHFMSVSSFSEYTVVHEHSCCKVVSKII